MRKSILVSIKGMMRACSEESKEKRWGEKQTERERRLTV